MKHSPVWAHSALAILAASLLALTACTQQLTLDLEPGDCVILPDSDNIASVTTTDCSDPHHAEVVGDIAIDGDTLPSSEDLEHRAQAECAPIFETYAGVPHTESAMILMWLLPTDASWKTGDRSITCIAVAPDRQTISQSLKDSGL